MVTRYENSEQLTGARIHLSDLTGLEIRNCEVTGLKVVDCYGAHVSLGGDLRRVVVNDVDVTAYVEGELDRRHPARALARDVDSPEDYRAAWSMLESLWDSAFERAAALPEAALHERVDGEWSFVETQRHLLFAADAWLGSAVLEESSPYDPWGLPAGGTPDDDAARLGLDLTSTPSFADVLDRRRVRMAVVRRTVGALTVAELDRVCARKPAHTYPDVEYVVRRCLRVVLREEAEHHRYAVRDLAVLEADRG